LDDRHPDELLLTSEQRQELAGIAYFLAQCTPLRDRGLINEEALGTITAEYEARREAIETRGRCEAALAAARRLMVPQPAEALAWADRARALDPGRPEAWVLAIEARKGRRDDEAEALAAEAVARFPGFPITPEDLEHERAVRQAQAQQRRADAEIADLLVKAREALDAHRDEEVVERTGKLLERVPGHFDARVLRAFALQRLDRLEEALTIYQQLVSHGDGSPVWARWVRNIEERLEARRGVLAATEAEAGRRPLRSVLPASTPTEPRVSWGSITGEFLKDHWQKLILCLAVLLIVVSSNVGLYQLLGPRLWSPPGKCLLTLVYTAMFAGFGKGLARWGALRAGRMMLVTTLILVPFDFMLAGEMRLLTEPTLARVVVLLLDAVALGVLIWRVVVALDLPRDGRAALIASLFAISVTNVAAAPGGQWPLAVFVLPSVLLIGAVWRLNTREGNDGEPDFTAIALGVLGFAWFSATLRIGFFVLHLSPALFALPVIFAAIAAVHTAHHLARRGQDPQWVQGLRFGGIVLSGLAFSLTLARPPAPSPLYSGNTLATALLGLALYAGALRAYRKPAYLYFGFGALFLAYFGSFYFLVDLIRAIEETARHALGYREKLPAPFKAINGLVFNTVLALLALVFDKRWKDARLARHAHYIGVPFSIAACVYSGFEPRAALLCLSGYALLYAVGVYLFAQPWVVYLACAATAGAAYFGTTLVPGVSIGDRALIAAALGLVFWAVERALRTLRVDGSYLRPLIYATLTLMTVALAGAAAALALPGAITLAAASTFFLVGVLAVLIGLDEPAGGLAVLAVVALNIGLGLLLPHLDARWRLGLQPAGFALAAMVLALAHALLGDWLARRVERGEPARTFGTYLRPVLIAGFVQVALGIGLVIVQLTRFAPPFPRGDLSAIAAALALGTAALVTLLRVFPRPEISHLASLLALGCWLALVEIALGGRVAPSAIYGASVSAFAVLLLAVAEQMRSWLAGLKTADPDFAADPPIRAKRLAADLPDFALPMALLATLLGLGSPNGPATVLLYALVAGVFFYGTRFHREKVLVYLGLIAGLAALECAVAWRVGTIDKGFTLGCLTLSAAGAAVGLWWAALVWRRRDEGAFFARPCLVVASILTVWVVPLAIFARLGSTTAFLPALAALAVNFLACLLISIVERRPALTYRAVVSFVVATYLILFSLGGPSPYGPLVASLTASLEAIVLSAIGIYCGYRPAESWGRIHARPLFVSATVLTMLSLLPGYEWSAAMVVAAVSFLVLVKGFASARWMYPAVAVLAWSLYHTFLTDWPIDRLVTAAMVGAYELWLLGLLVRRINPALRHWFDLPGLNFDRPLFNASLVAAGVAMALGLDQAIEGPYHGGDLAGLALNLAVLALLMIKAYPDRGWVHLAIVLASASAGFEASDHVRSPLDWVPLAFGLANVGLLAARGLARIEGPLCRSVGVPDLDFATIPELWARAFAVLAGAATACLVLVATLITVFSIPIDVDLLAVGGWWSILVALGLAGIYLAVEFSRRDGELFLIGTHALGVLLTWWLFAPSSPIATRWGSGVVATGIPPATALGALATAVLGLRFPSYTTTKVRLSGYLWQMGHGLALVAVIFTKGQISPASIATLLATTAALGFLSARRRSVETALLAALVWSAGCIETALEIGGRWGFRDLEERAIACGVGAGVAMLVLGAVAGRLRRFEVLRPLALALALERVALLGAGLAVVAVGVGTSGIGRIGGIEAILGVGVLFSVALFMACLAERWEVEWPVYAGQAALLGAYFVYRAAFPRPVANDAALLTLFGYLDFGLSEAMHQLRLNRYVRPTRYFSLAIPLLPLLTMASTGQLDEQNLFVLFGVATFYAVACFRLEWRTLGYVSAVLYNAALWVLWARVGWKFADNPQLFLVPVGFSTILFAEVNRRELGRDTVNAIRGVGLILVYLSLAFPIWQFQSFGDWLALLLLSLLGIFVGIGLRVQTFVWLGLAGFFLDIVYQLGRMGLEDSLARWAIGLALGLALILFVALNEKKRIVLTLQGYYEQVRQWE
jgi:hypothetical protein